MGKSSDEDEIGRREKQKRHHRHGHHHHTHHNHKSHHSDDLPDQQLSAKTMEANGKHTSPEVNVKSLGEANDEQNA